MLTHSLRDTDSSCRSLAAAGLACPDELKRRKYKKRLGGRHTICVETSRALTTDEVVGVVTPHYAKSFGAAVAEHGYGICAVNILDWTLPRCTWPLEGLSWHWPATQDVLLRPLVHDS
jgi:hypothetical protein